MYKALITTSGTGSRLKELTQNTNKSLVEVNGKKVIDYIIQSYPPEIELVFTIGYFGNQVREYVRSTYQDRKLTFVEVDKFDGPSTSLGYSMLQAKNSLQCPFIFHCNDTIIKGTIPSPETGNWDGVSRGSDPSIFNTQSYSSVRIKDDHITSMQAKGAAEWDCFHIGLVGIKDYQEFWEILQDLYDKNPNDSTLNDCAVISEMIKRGFEFKPVIFEDWTDTGNLVSFEHARQKLH